MDFFIVTPSYNQRHFLQQTIDNVLQQRFQGERVHWIFDGASTDGTTQLLKKYGKKISWQSKKDKGQTDAINKGIKELKKWLKKTKRDPQQVIFAYLNSDDYYLPNAFSKVEQALEKSPNKQWLVGDCLIVNQRGQEIQPWVRWYKKMWRLMLSKTVLGVLNPIPQPGVFVRATEILKNGFFNERLNYTMDYEYWFKLINKSGQPIQLSEPLAAFRIHDNAKGSQNYQAQFAEQYQVTKQYTQNQAILTFQQLHNWLTVSLYRFLKS